MILGRAKTGPAKAKVAAEAVTTTVQGGGAEMPLPEHPERVSHSSHTFLFFAGVILPSSGSHYRAVFLSEVNLVNSFSCYA